MVEDGSVWDIKILSIFPHYVMTLDCKL